MNKQINGAENSSAPSSSALLSVTSVLIFTLSGAILPLMLLQSNLLPIFAWVTFILCIATLFSLTKRIFLCIIAVMSFASLASSSALIGISAAAIGCIMSIGLFSSQILIGRKGSIISAILSPVSAYLLSFALTGNLIVSAFSLICLPAALGIGIAKRRGASLGTVCISGTAATIISALAVMLIDIVAYYGYLSLDLVRSIIESSQNIAIEFLKIAFTAAGTAVTDVYAANIADIVSSVMNLLPGVVCMTLLIACYLSHGICKRAAESADVDGGDSTLTYSTISAIVFIACYVLSFTTDSSGNVAFISTVGANLAFMLLPGLLIIGITALVKMIFKLRLIGLILAAALIFATFFFSLFILALLGAAYTIIVNIDVWAKDHYSKNNN